MDSARILSWGFRIEGIAVCAFGGVVLLWGLGTGFAVSAGWMDLALGSDVLKGALFAAVGGMILTIAGLPLLFAARSIRRHPAGRPSAALAVAVGYHVLLLAVVGLSLL